MTEPADDPAMSDYTVICARFFAWTPRVQIPLPQPDLSARSPVESGCFYYSIPSDGCAVPIGCPEIVGS